MKLFWVLLKFIVGFTLVVIALSIMLLDAAWDAGERR
jgi:hypothetical protein